MYYLLASYILLVLRTKKRLTTTSVSSVATIDEMKTSGNDWVLANHNVVGYYRVNYDPDNWDKLLQSLNDDHEVRYH